MSPAAQRPVERVAVRVGEARQHHAVQPLSSQLRVDAALYGAEAARRTSNRTRAASPSGSWACSPSTCSSGISRKRAQHIGQGLDADQAVVSLGELGGRVGDLRSDCGRRSSRTGSPHWQDAGVVAGTGANGGASSGTFCRRLINSASKG